MLGKCYTGLGWAGLGVGLDEVTISWPQSLPGLDRWHLCAEMCAFSGGSNGAVDLSANLILLIW